MKKGSPAISGLVTLYGYPAFLESIKDLIDEASKKCETKVFDYNLEYIKSFVKEIDPYEKIKNFAPKPLLIICGKKDTICPCKINEKLYNRLASYYENEIDKIKMSIYDIGHGILLPEIEDEILEWLIKYFSE